MPDAAPRSLAQNSARCKERKDTGMTYDTYAGMTYDA
jgi:hypothetical protein